MTRIEAVTKAAQRLLAAGIEPSEARIEASLLLRHALGITPEEIRLRPETVLSTSEAADIDSLLIRRENREPLAYILGERYFYGLPFCVTPAVLIPRPETEFVVEAVQEAIANAIEPCRIVDIGTGSGCIAVAVLAHASALVQGFASDLSTAALTVAQANAERNGVAERITFLHGDFLAPVQSFAPFRVIASNPPYIAPAEIETLAPEVRDWEPRIALGIDPDPLYFYRRFATEAPPLLEPGGHLIVEVGQGQAEAVGELFRRGGLINIEIRADLAGIWRVVSGINPRH